MVGQKFGMRGSLKGYYKSVKFYGGSYSGRNGQAQPIMLCKKHHVSPLG
jgi:hypothetical protein